MKITMNLSGKSLDLEPETDFERDIVGKYFKEDTTTMVGENGLRIKWSGPVVIKS